ncbi:MAG: DUF59 domain-containing protein [Candidatus Woesearchaeota archaeon]|nr:MAG: DUF59 domain-containing protein [Candidatus Woesearchaeota archaeon]
MVTKEQVNGVLKTVKDPEIGMDMVTLGLVYDIKIDNDKVDILMTLTTPICPFGPQMVEEVKQKIGFLKGVKEVNVEITFNPPWEPSEELRATLGV